jgi:hypothetical protein
MQGSTGSEEQCMKRTEDSLEWFGGQSRSSTSSGSEHSAKVSKADADGTMNSVDAAVDRSAGEMVSRPIAAGTSRRFDSPAVNLTHHLCRRQYYKWESGYESVL